MSLTVRQECQTAPSPYKIIFLDPYRAKPTRSIQFRNFSLQTNKYLCSNENLYPIEQKHHSFFTAIGTVSFGKRRLNRIWFVYYKMLRILLYFPVRARDELLIHMNELSKKCFQWGKKSFNQKHNCSFSFMQHSWSGSTIDEKPSNGCQWLRVGMGIMYWLCLPQTHCGDPNSNTWNIVLFEMVSWQN